jgi:hypothetical protein
MKINVVTHSCVLSLLIAGFLFVLPRAGFAQKNNLPGGPEEPVRVLCDSISLEVFDGRLRYAIGVENIQVLRANRTRPDMADNYGWTYNHAPMLAYWNDKFYLEYLSNPFGEHLAPGQTLVATSGDGRTWDMPRQVFPIYLLRPGPILGYESGMAMMHQRMGFYVAPNGRLLVLGFYGQAPNVMGVGGIGRVVREAYKDGTYGPIYFIRYSFLGKRNESNTSTFPFYARSGDKGFVDACNSLLCDKLKTMQWWEEDRTTDGFFTVTGQQAPSVYHRKDGMAVAHWKASYAAISPDEGKTWSTPVRIPGIITDGAKTWGQRTVDGRYALVYNPANYGSHRWPLAVVTSDDGIVFDNMLLVHGEVPPRRYMGRAKDFGPQYVRGISEGDGTPPGSDMWITYSVNKEDMWVSRIPVPIRYRIDGPVEDFFNGLDAGRRIPDWNIYRTRLATAEIVAFPGPKNRCLELKDSDPYDYARAVRVFEESKHTGITFKVFARDIQNGRLELEVLDHSGHRPIRVIFGEDGHIRFSDGNDLTDGGRYEADTWYQIKIDVNVAKGKYDLLMDNRMIVNQALFAESVSSIERISFRTGAYRTEPTRQTDRYAGGDLPNPGDPVLPVVYYIDDVIIK